MAWEMKITSGPLKYTVYINIDSKRDVYGYILIHIPIYSEAKRAVYGSQSFFSTTVLDESRTSALGSRGRRQAQGGVSREQILRNLAAARSERQIISSHSGIRETVFPPTCRR